MAKRKPLLPDYGTAQIKGKTYFRTRISDDEGNRISLYAASREELYEKVMEVEKQIENKTFRRSTPTVREYFGFRCDTASSQTHLYHKSDS